ncbi:hypothetical protein LTR53_004711 [Teratosphaeriaceae sp. CCFEE 6253]|nr:hypothetical protein LTR53_004711 [Teratosphaeriaceae sp. CCFEE 6253]
MGACASCLGLDRHPSPDDRVDETDALLDSVHGARYGSVGSIDVAQPDQEELRREREALERITAEATDNMIDIAHPGSADFSHHFAHTPYDRRPAEANGPAKLAAAVDDAEEAAWLQAVQSAGDGAVTQVKGLQSGALIIDMSQFRLGAPTGNRTAEP